MKDILSYDYFGLSLMQEENTSAALIDNDTNVKYKRV